jgi:hypothetical protein
MSSTNIVLTKTQLEAHIWHLRTWGESFGDVGDYRRQILALCETYEDDLKYGRFIEGDDKPPSQ